MNVLVAIYKFLGSVVLTGKGVFKYDIPKASKTETVNLLGSTYKVTESVDNGVAKIEVEKQ